MNMNVDPGLEDQIRQIAAQTGKPVHVVAQQMGYAPLSAPPGQQFVGMAGSMPWYQPLPTGKGPGQILQDKMDQANAANEARYQDLLKTNAGTKNEALGAINTQYGDILKAAGSGVATQLEREQRGTKERRGDFAAQLGAHGLGSTTVQSSFDRALVDDSALRQREIEAQGRRETMGARQDYAGLLANTIQQTGRERVGIIQDRTDQAPNLGLYANLLSQPTGTGYPMGGGGGSHHAPSGFGGFNIDYQNALRPPVEMPAPVDRGKGVIQMPANWQEAQQQSPKPYDGSGNPIAPPGESANPAINPFAPPGQSTNAYRAPAPAEPTRGTVEHRLWLTNYGPKANKLEHSGWAGPAQYTPPRPNPNPSNKWRTTQVR